MQFHARTPSFLVLIQRGLFVHDELTGRNSHPPSGQDPRHLVMPPSVRKTADNSSSGVGITCYFKSRPAFSFRTQSQFALCGRQAAGLSGGHRPPLEKFSTGSKLFVGQAGGPSSSPAIFFCFLLFQTN